MKKLIILICLLISASVMGASLQKYDHKSWGPITMTASPVTLTATFMDVGELIDARKFNKVKLYLDVDINDSVDVGLKLLGSHTAGGTEYEYAITTTSSSLVTIKPLVYQFSNDADKSYVIEFDVGEFGYVQFQANAVTSTGTPAQVANPKYILISR